MSSPAAISMLRRRLLGGGTGPGPAVGMPERAVPALAAHTLRVRIDEGCITLRGVECRICGESCDARAIRFVPQSGAVARPALDPSTCTGCGECVAPCPVAALSVINLAVINPWESEQ